MSRRLRLSISCALPLAAVVMALHAGEARTRIPAPAYPSSPGSTTGQGEADGVREREQAFLDERAYPRPIPERAYMAAVAQAHALQTRTAARARAGTPQANADPTSLVWKALGPRPISYDAYSLLPDSYDFNNTLPWSGTPPYSGRISAIAPHPTNPDIVYVGGGTGGVWKTTDGGITWTPIFDDQPSLSIGAIAVDPGDGQVVYVGTGEANLGSGMYPGVGIYKSTDGGGSWSKLGGSTFDRCFTADIVVQPGNSSTVLAAVHNQASQSSTTSCPSGVYRSTNGGATWTKVPAAGRPADLTVATAAPNIWYLGSSDGTGVQQSIDGGATWAPVGAGLPTTQVGRTAVATSANGSRVYVAIGNPDDETFRGIWTSTNGGGSWTALPYDVELCAHLDGGKLSGGQCSYDLTLALDPANDSRFFIGGIRLYHYVNGSYGGGPIALGVSTDPNNVHVDFHALAYDAAGRLWLGSDGGVYRTADGQTFANLNTDLGITQFYALDGSLGGGLVGGTQDNGSVRSDGTAGWIGVTGADGGVTAVDPRYPYVHITTQQNVALYRSFDGGRTHVYVGPGCGAPGSWYDADCNDEPHRFTAPYVMAPGTPTTLYVGTMRVYRTTNLYAAPSSVQWQPISPYFGDVNDPVGNRISVIAPAPSDPNTIYIGTSRGEVRVTTDGGASWPTRTAAPFPVTDCAPDQGSPPQFCRFVTDIAVDDQHANVAYVTVSGFGSGHVFKTTDFGVTWNDISGSPIATGLPDAPANSIVIDPTVSPARLFVATDVGVFWTDDGGASWKNTSVGLPNTIQQDLVLDRGAHALIVATHGRGVFTAPLPGSTLPADGDVLFTSGRSGNLDIYRAAPDGTGVVDLTASSSATDDAPVWSPDRTKIAFESNRDGDYDVYVMNADGSGVQKLTTDPLGSAFDGEPSWAPDSKSIAFASNRGGNWDIYRVDAVGGLTRLTSDSRFEYDPSWSPSGTRIAYVRAGPGAAAGDTDYDIWSMDAADGANKTAVTSTPSLDEYEPAWSPSGTRIAFSRQYPGSTDANPDYDIWTANPDGSSAVDVTNLLGIEQQPSWSPDGTQIVFAGRPDSVAGFDIRRIPAAGGTAVRLTGVVDADISPDWGSIPPGPVTLPPAPPDTEPPSAPTSLAASPSSTTAVALSWGTSYDNLGVVGYRVYRNGTLIASTSALAYADGGLSPATTYSYVVRAYDAAGNLGPESNPASATTLPDAGPPPPPPPPPPPATDTAPPTTPTGLTATATSTTQVSVTWAASTDNVGVAGYRLLRDGVELTRTSSTTVHDGGLAPGSTHTYVVYAYDAAGNVSPPSQAVQVRLLSDVVVTPPVQCVVPSLRGRTLAAARLALTHAHCRLGAVGYAYSATVAPGRVVAQTARAGRHAAAGTHVGVTVSKGKKKKPRR